MYLNTNTMERLYILLIGFWMIGMVYPQCPKQCKCEKKEWSCTGKNITNEILLEIAKSGDPLTAKRLNLRDNNITNFPFHEFKAFTILEELNLGKNHLTKVPADLKENIPSLLKISLNENNLRKLATDDFVGYDNIEELMLKVTISKY